jgi:hypothetical protein
MPAAPRGSEYLAKQKPGAEREPGFPGVSSPAGRVGASPLRVSIFTKKKIGETWRSARTRFDVAGL